MKYVVTHSCGHEEEVNLVGSSRDRERKLAWLESQPCRACQEEAAAKRNKEREKELGLPDLEGSEKQISWATTIRLERFKELDEFIKACEGSLEAGAKKLKEAEEKGAEAVAMVEQKIARYEERLRKAMAALEVVSTMTDSHWWINHRNGYLVEFFEACKELEDQKKEEEIEAETAPEAVVMQPEAPKTTTVAELKAKDGLILMLSDKDETIRLAVKAHGFSWNIGKRAWVKRVTEMTGKAEDLLADTARILLEAGIPVKGPASLKEALESGNYEPECHRWVAVSEGGDKLAINQIKGVSNYPAGKETWRGDYILVSPNLWREVREFAGLNGYKITRKADEMLRKAEEATVSIKLARPQGEAGGADKLKEILESSRDILDDLKEED